MKAKLSANQIKIVFFGTPQFSTYTLTSIYNANFNILAVVTQAKSAQNRSKKLIPSPIAVLAHNLKIPFILEPEQIDQNLIKNISDLQPDIFVVVAYGNILPQKLLDIPKLGAINLHPSLLPAYRGPAPVQKALLDGVDKTGVTIMLLDKKVDHGPILSQITIPISTLDTAITLHNKLFKQGALLLTDTLLDFVSNKLTPQPQNDLQATTTKMIKKNDGLIDWKLSAESLQRQIKAYQPWPGSYTYYKDKMYKFFLAEVIDSIKLSPGEVYIKKPDQFIVGTGEKNLKILELQIAGGKKIDVKIYLSGLRETKLFFSTYPKT